MHMYCTTNVDMPEDFRAELGHFMKEMRIIVVKFIQNRGEKCEVGNYPCTSPSIDKCVRFCTNCPILSIFSHVLSYHGMVPDC